MSDNDRVLRDILVHVGETRKGMETLESDVGGIRRQLHDLGRTAVPKDECTSRHTVVAQSIDGVKAELRSDLQQIKADVRTIKTRTGPEHPVVPRNNGNGIEVGKAHGPKYWLGILTAAISILSFLGAILWGMVKVGQYMERVDRTINASAKSQQKFQSTVKRVATQEPRVVYVQVPVHPDAGVTKQRRRRRSRTRTRRRTNTAGSGARPATNR